MIHSHSILFLFILASLPFFACAQTDAQSEDEWTLVWSDEFNNETLNRDKWAFQNGTGAEYGLNGWGNNELQYYTDRSRNVYLEDGSLVIKAMKEDYMGSSYTSSKLVTLGKQSWKYGKFEIRAKVPETQGIWPAIWMMPEESVYGGWPASGEIDIMELLGHQPDTVYGTVHFGESFRNRSSDTGKTWLNSSDFSEGYHVFGLVWEKDRISWTIDGEVFHRVEPDDLSPFNWPFDQPFYLILNVAVGGNWPGYPDATTVLPQTMHIDYVRVYQREP